MLRPESSESSKMSGQSSAVSWSKHSWMKVNEIKVNKERRSFCSSPSSCIFNPPSELDSYEKWLSIRLRTVLLRVQFTEIASTFTASTHKVTHKKITAHVNAFARARCTQTYVTLTQVRSTYRCTCSEPRQIQLKNSRDTHPCTLRLCATCTE